MVLPTVWATHSPGVDAIGCPGPPEELAQVLADALPQDLAGALALLATAHHKLVQVERATAHTLRGDDGSSAVPDREAVRGLNSPEKPKTSTLKTQQVVVTVIAVQVGLALPSHN